VGGSTPVKWRTRKSSFLFLILSARYRSDGPDDCLFGAPVVEVEENAVTDGEVVGIEFGLFVGWHRK
jgi:hypothetical protein